MTRLVAVDPGNPQNYTLAARAYVDIAETRKGAAATTAVNDTTMMWFNKGSQLPVEVTITEMTPGEKSLELGGHVLDRRDKAAQAAAGSTSSTRSSAKKAAAPAKSTFPPKAVTLKFEALDKAGAVIGSQSVTVDPLEPGKSARLPGEHPGGERPSLSLHRLRLTSTRYLIRRVRPRPDPFVIPSERSESRDLHLAEREKLAQQTPSEVLDSACLRSL